MQDAFNLVGLPWPGIDEDQLRAWASDLRSYSAEINTLSGSSRSAVAALASSNSSSVAKTLAAQWDKHARLISDLRGPMDAMTTLSGALSGHASRVETASTVSWRKAGNGSLAEGGPGGGWAEVARAVEQTVLQVLKQLFVDLAHALWKILSDTAAFLKKAVEDYRRTDEDLAADAKREGDAARAGHVGSPSPVDVQGADPDGVPLPGGFKKQIQKGDVPGTRYKSPEADLARSDLEDKPPHPGNADKGVSYDEGEEAAFMAAHGISQDQLDAGRPRDLMTYSGLIRPVWLEPGTKVFRVVGNEIDPAGGYWTPELPDPATWRQDLAVLHGWNGNGAIETVVLDKPVIGWAGTTASQPVFDADNNVVGYYRGGAQQLYINFKPDYPDVDTSLIRSAKIRAFGG